MSGIAGIIEELEQQRSALEHALEALRGTGSAPAKRRGRPPGKKAPRGGKRYFTAESRARMAEAQRRRWAKKRLLSERQQRRAESDRSPEPSLALVAESHVIQSQDAGETVRPNLAR